MFWIPPVCSLIIFNLTVSRLETGLRPPLTTLWENHWTWRSDRNWAGLFTKHYLVNCFYSISLFQLQTCLSLSPNTTKQRRHLTYVSKIISQKGCSDLVWMNGFDSMFRRPRWLALRLDISKSFADHYALLPAEIYRFFVSAHRSELIGYSRA